MVSAHTNQMSCSWNLGDVETIIPVVCELLLFTEVSRMEDKGTELWLFKKQMGQSHRKPFTIICHHLPSFSY
jgi:hypothetical protein